MKTAAKPLSQPEAVGFDTDARVRSVFRDAYALESPRLESLYSKSKRHQWDAELDVDWQRFEPDVDILDRKGDFLFRLACVQELPSDQQSALFKAANVFLVSQVLHGEQAALMTCGQLVNLVPEMDAKLAAAAQVIDEARHVEVFTRYLERQRKRYPIDPDLQAIVQALLAEPDWEVKCVGMQIILESVALSFFRLGQEMAVEPVFAEFIGRVHEDEARHVAYGVLTLEERIPRLSQEARRRLEDWAYDAIARIGGRAGKPSFNTQFQALADAGLDLARFLPKLLAEANDPAGVDVEGIRDPMTDTVIPNLLRVGLIPPRLVQGYLAQGWKLDVEAGKVTDLHTWHPETQQARADFQERGRDFSDPGQASL